MQSSVFPFTFTFPGPGLQHPNWEDVTEDIDSWGPECDSLSIEQSWGVLRDFLDCGFHLEDTPSNHPIEKVEAAIDQLAGIKLKHTIQGIRPNTALEVLQFLCRPTREFQLDHAAVETWINIVSTSSVITLEDKAHLAAHMMVASGESRDPSLDMLGTAEEKIAHCLQRYQMDLQLRHHYRIDDQIFTYNNFDDLPADEAVELLGRAVRASGRVRSGLYNRIMRTIWTITADLSSSDTLTARSGLIRLISESDVSLQEWVNFCMSVRRPAGPQLLNPAQVGMNEEM